jgi:uncharacterized protein YbaR (Trm112 family)
MGYEDLIKRLRCPADKAELDHYPGKVLVCRVCARAYPISEGIPVMLVDERVQADGAKVLAQVQADAPSPSTETSGSGGADEPSLAE